MYVHMHACASCLSVCSCPVPNGHPLGYPVLDVCIPKESSALQLVQNRINGESWRKRLSLWSWPDEGHQKDGWHRGQYWPVCKQLRMARYTTDGTGSPCKKYMWVRQLHI